MSEPLEFDNRKFDEGETAFMRGITVATLVRQINAEIRDPNTGKDGGAELEAQWALNQIQREKNGVGLMLGYVNGFAQAIRRIDNQLRLDSTSDK